MRVYADAPENAGHEPGQDRRAAEYHLSAGAEIREGHQRISASRLQHISHILQVPVPFFFEGAPHQSGSGGPALPAYVSEFLSSTDGLALVKAFPKIKEAKLRRRVLQLVEEIAGDEPISQACR
jgi:hypothetical protein